MKDELKNLCLKLAYAVDRGEQVGYEAAKMSLEPHRAELERLAKSAKGQDQATAKAALALLDPKKKDEDVGFDLDGGGSKEPAKPTKKPETKVAAGGEEPPKDDKSKDDEEKKPEMDEESNPSDGELPPELQPEVEDPAPRPVRAGGGDDGPRQPRRREANEGSGFNWWWLVLLLVILTVIAVLIGQKIGGGGTSAPPTATTTPATPPAMTKEELLEAYRSANDEQWSRLSTELDKTNDAIKAADKTSAESIQVKEFKTCAENPNSPDCLAGEADAHKFYGDLDAPKKATK